MSVWGELYVTIACLHIVLFLLSIITTIIKGADMDNGQIILFQTQGGKSKIEVRLSNETGWLTADKMVELFQRDHSTIQRHIKRIYSKGELTADWTCAFFAQVQMKDKGSMNVLMLELWARSRYAFSMTARWGRSGMTRTAAGGSRLPMLFAQLTMSRTIEGR